MALIPQTLELFESLGIEWIQRLAISHILLFRNRCPSSQCFMPSTTDTLRNLVLSR